MTAEAIGLGNHTFIPYDTGRKRLGLWHFCYIGLRPVPAVFLRYTRSFQFSSAYYVALSGTLMAEPAVGIIMGSRSDWGVMENAALIFDTLGVSYETKVVSAHRTPDRLYKYARSARERGLQAIIAGAGGAAHLPGMAAAMTPVPVLGVPVDATVLNGIDALLSIVQMPKGVPVATFAVGKPGAVNAALFAAAMLANEDAVIRAALDHYREAQSASVPINPVD
jgi:5-(carboxyamino)imidazole ribonucleotide mutase